MSRVISPDGSVKFTHNTQDHTHSDATGDGGNTIDLNGAGELILDADGDTKIYSTSDDTPVFIDGALASAAQRLGSITSGITVTVKTSGGDFSTIQSAIDYFSSKSVLAASGVTIAVDPGVWSENLSISGAMSFNPGGIVLQGDTRTLAGMAFVRGAPLNQSGVANGGSGTCTITSSGAVITVTGSTTNPDFAADGWGSGDTIYLSGDGGGVGGYTIQSTSGNTITCTSSVLAMTQDGVSLQMRPNRRVGNGSTALNVAASRVKVTGFHFMGAGLGTGVGVTATNQGILVLERTAVTHSYYGILTSWGGFVSAGRSDVSTFYHNIGWFAYLHSYIYAAYAYAIGHSIGAQYGFYSDRAGALEAYYGIAARCGTGHFNTTNHGYMYAIGSYARGNAAGIGWQSSSNATMLAHTTNTHHNVATAYSPAPTIPGWAQGASWGILYASA